VPGSTTDELTPKIAAAYQRAGVDAINVTGGWHESRVPQLPMELPRTAYAFLARNIKDAVTIPVMASNRIASPDDAERILRDGYADMVNLGRVLIADPQVARKGRLRGGPMKSDPAWPAPRAARTRSSAAGRCIAWAIREPGSRRSGKSFLPEAPKTDHGGGRRCRRAGGGRYRIRKGAPGGDL
jgi:2,4-dienoyl-CoA reductase-like NADH-dependent reductase (Old Yellow Enzyme family)